VRRQACRLLLAVAYTVLGGCAVTDVPPMVTVADVPHALPASSSPVRGTVTDSRMAPNLLVELSDPTREEHIWVSGFARAPARGEEVWTAIVGPPVPHELVGVVYPSTGIVEPPVAITRVTPRSALAAVLGSALATVLLVLALVLASGWARRSRHRRCGGCSAAVASRWLTCPRCGRPLTAPAEPERPPAEIALAPDPVELPDDGRVEPAAPTRITRGDQAG